MPDSALSVQADPESLEKLKRLQARRRKRADSELGRYYADPVAFATDCIAWPIDQSLSEYQAEALDALPHRRRVCVRSLHGTGKTTMESIAVLWFALTRDAVGRDWKCPTTAGAWNQLEKYLWPEIRKWSRLLRWDRIHRDPFGPNEMLSRTLRLRFGSAFAVASAIPQFIEGVHGDSVLYIYDEAKSIPVATWDAAEGAFTGAEGTEAMALACSTPGEPIGRFYDIQSRRAGTEDWHTVHISLDRALAARRVDPAWVEQRRLLWGPSSAIFANRVLGEFHSSDEDSIVPLSWVEQAVTRWEDHRDGVLAPLDRVGVDVARSGMDSTVVALIYGHRVNELRRTFHESTAATAGRVRGVLDTNLDAQAVVDTDGLGAGVTDMLRDDGYTVRAFHGAAASNRRDRSGELGFLNARAAAWWHMREALDPEQGATLELPPDDLLIGDLTAPKLKRVNRKSQIEIESKDDIRKRLGRSTDAGDAVVMGLYPGDRPRRRRRMKRW